jgi:transcriptional regulator with XRE-family HTH domain
MIGTRIKIAREHKGMTQTELARLVDMSQQGVNKIEKKIHIMPKNIKKFAQALGVSEQYLAFGNVDERHSEINTQKDAEFMAGYDKLPRDLVRTILSAVDNNLLGDGDLSLIMALVNRLAS